MDDIDVLGLAQDDPKSLLSVRSDTIIDEIQRAPAVLPVIKSLVDENRERRYVLSGSANLLLMKRVTETLAGRSTFFHLLPFSYREWMFKDKEVDFIYELGQKAIAVEVKFARTISLSDILNLKCFLDNYKKALAGLVVYNGDEMVYLTENIIAVPWTALC